MYGEGGRWTCLNCTQSQPVWFQGDDRCKRRIRTHHFQREGAISVNFDLENVTFHSMVIDQLFNVYMLTCRVSPEFGKVSCFPGLRRWGCTFSSSERKRNLESSDSERLSFTGRMSRGRLRGDGKWYRDAITPRLLQFERRVVRVVVVANPRRALERRSVRSLAASQPRGTEQSHHMSDNLRNLHHVAFILACTKRNFDIT